MKSRIALYDQLIKNWFKHFENAVILISNIEAIVCNLTCSEEEEKEAKGNQQPKYYFFIFIMFQIYCVGTCFR